MKQLFEDLAEEPGSDLQSSIQCHRRGVALVRLPSRLKLKLTWAPGCGHPEVLLLGSLPGAVNMQTALGSNINPRLLNQERREGSTLGMSLSSWNCC